MENFWKIFRNVVLDLIVLLNTLILYLLVILVMSLAGVQMNKPLHFIIAILLSLLIMGGFIYLGLTPVGENLERIQLHLRKPYPDEMERIHPLFQEVLERSGIKRPVQIFIVKDKFPNAFAIGNETVSLTTGLLKLATDDEIKGVIAHELGHLNHGDTKITTVANVANEVGNVSLIILTVMAVVSSALAKFTSWFSWDSDTFILMRIFALSILVFAWIIKGLIWVLKLILGLSYRTVGRRAEFAADDFAASLGYKNGLISFLRKLEDSEEDFNSQKMSLFEVAFQTHPSTGMRLERFYNH